MKGQTRSPVASARGRPFDRHSATGVRGLPKKKGAGSKGVWGAEMDQHPVMVLDEKDPNYDSEEESHVSMSASSLRVPIAAPAKENKAESAACSPVNGITADKAAK
eukprot:IDg16072t1